MKRLDFLKRQGFSLCVGTLPKSTLGVTMFDLKSIVIDVPKNVVATFLHEYMHVRRPKASEKATEKSAIKIMARMTNKEISQLALRIMRGGRR